MKSRRSWGPPTLWAQHGGSTKISEQDSNMGVFIPIFEFYTLRTTSICYWTNPALLLAAGVIDLKDVLGPELSRASGRGALV